MKIELNEGEKVVLDELLESAYKEKLHELHHTASNAYKSLLRERLATIEALMGKLAVPAGG